MTNLLQIPPEQDRAARRAALMDAHDRAVERSLITFHAYAEASEQAGGAAVDPALLMNYEAYRDECARLAYEIAKLQEVES